MYTSKSTAAVLAFFGGNFGLHRFYLGQWWGIFYVLLFWTYLPGLIGIIEAVVFATRDQGKWNDKYNNGLFVGREKGRLFLLFIFLILFVASIGILAAIAIPAYHDYTNRAKLVERMHDAAEIVSSGSDVLSDGSSDSAEAIERCEGYRYGENGYREDYDQAFTWCTEAAKNGHPVGQSILGALYYNGYGVEQSYRDSIYWFTLAANQKMPHAAYSLFWMYLHGLGTERDQDTAFMYLARSADLGYEAAGKYLEIPEGDSLVTGQTEEHVEALLGEGGVAKVAPMYPRLAQHMGIEGYTTVEYCVDREGRTTNIRVVDSRPERVFDEVSIAAAKNFRYKPEVVDGVPIERHGVVNKFTFELKK